MLDDVNAKTIRVPSSLKVTETGRVTSSIFHSHIVLGNTAEHDEVPEYLKSYQKAQAAALFSHSACPAHQEKAKAGHNGNFMVSAQSLSREQPCPSCNSCALILACAPVSNVIPAPRRKVPIFRRLANRLKRFGRKTGSGS